MGKRRFVGVGGRAQRGPAAQAAIRSGAKTYTPRLEKNGCVLALQKNRQKPNAYTKQFNSQKGGSMGLVAFSQFFRDHGLDERNMGRYPAKVLQDGTIKVDLTQEIEA